MGYSYYFLHYNVDISPRKRAKVLTLHQHTKMSQREIAKAVCISQATVHRLIKNVQIENTEP